MQKRDYTTIGASYRFGFNSMEEDDEVKGNGNSLDFGARIYNCRIARWSSIDPLFGRYSSFSPFTYAASNPVLLVDIDGRDIGLNRKMRKSKKHQAALETARYSTIFNTYLEYFGSTSSGDMKTDKDGVLSKHQLNLNAGTTDSYGKTTIYIDNGNGKFKEYKEGDKIGKDAKFRIDIDIISYLSMSEFDVGEFAGSLAHEMLVHAAEAIDLIVAFEEAVEAADGDPAKIKIATEELNKGMTEWAKNNMDEKKVNSSKAHQAMLNGETQLDESLKEMKKVLQGKIDDSNTGDTDKETYKERKKGVEQVEKDDINQ